MPTLNVRPLTIVPAGVSDAIDGTNAFPGAMAALTNLVPSPGDTGIFVPRPAATELLNFSSFTNAGQVSTLGAFSGVLYGMIASGRFAGKEEPFAYDIKTATFLPIQGVTAANCPAQLPTTGEWVPPVIAPVSASKTVVAHAGFPGGPGPYFGWFDTSGFSLNTLKGNITNGSAVITSIYDGSTSAPILDGVQPGQLISGPGIPAGATVVSATNGTFSKNTTGTTDGTTGVVTGIPSTAGVLPGMTVAGPEFTAGTYVLSVDSSTQVTVSAVTLSAASGTAVDFSGGGTITISANATASSNLAALAVAGGTPSSPLWAAGNTNTNPLTSVPVSVAQFNGRAWYATGNTLVFSDALNPLQVTLASQALTLDGREPITALAGQPLSNQVTGGIVQALLAFKGADIVYQITGDQATSNLTSSAVNGSVGTLAPATICATPLGTVYISPDGLRIIGLNGYSSPPAGIRGTGVAVPFIQTLTPSRMTAAYNQNIYRVTVDNSLTGAVEEWWLDVTSMRWTGPHTFPAGVITNISTAGLMGFVMSGYTISNSLWFSSAVPTLNSTYEENGQQLNFTFQTVLLPDNQEGKMNSVIESTQAMALPYNIPITFSVYDDSGDLIDSIVKNVPVVQYLYGSAIYGVGRYTAQGSQTTWGSFVWGASPWGASANRYKQHTLPWSQPLVFKQASVTVTGQCVANFAIGNTYVKYRELGYTAYADN